MLQKVVRIAKLYDYYGPLLSRRQREFIELYYHYDLSLGEIAQQYGVSRQAVHDILRRAEDALERFEARLGFLQQRAKWKQTWLVIFEELNSFRADASGLSLGDKKRLDRILERTQEALGY